MIDIFIFSSTDQFSANTIIIMCRNKSSHIFNETVNNKIVLKSDVEFSLNKNKHYNLFENQDTI